MRLRHDAVGPRLHEATFVADDDTIAAYAAAVTGAGEDVPTTSVAPPLFSIVAGWDAMEHSVRAVLPDDLVGRILHVSQDMLLHRPIRAGDRLVSSGRIAGIEGGRRTTTVVAHCATSTEDGTPVAEFYAGIYVFGHGGEADAGERARDFKTARAGEPVATVQTSVADDQAARYADASGDHNPIHLDDAAAAAVGQPGRILHGMCTMGLAAATAVRSLCSGDPARLRRFAGRFSKPVRPGDRLETTYWPSAPGVFAFEVTGPEGAAIRHGRAEVA